MPKSAVRRLGTCSFRQGAAITGLAVSPDGRLVASAAGDQGVRIWEATTGAERARWKPRQRDYPPDVKLSAVAFSPRGTSVAAAGQGGVWVWDWHKEAGGPRALSIAQDTWVTSGAFSPDGKRLGYVDWHGNLAVWDLASQKEVLRVPAEQDPADSSGGYYQVAFSPKGDYLASADPDGTVRLWALESLKEARRLKGHVGRVRALAISTRGDTLASGSKDGTLRLWDVATGRELARLGGHAYCDAIAFLPDGTGIVSGDGKGRVRVWELPTGRLLKEFQGSRSGVLALAVSPDGKTLLAGGEHEVLWRWDLTTGQLLDAGPGHRARVTSVAFSPDGRRLATASDDGTARLWEVGSGRLLAAYEGHRDKVRAVAYALDGRSLATAGDDGTVRLWQASPGGKQALVFQGHQRPVYHVAYCQGGRLLASSGGDRMLRLWQPATGKELHAIRSEEGLLAGLAGSPGTTGLAVGSSSQFVVLDPEDGDERYSVPAQSTLAYSPDGRMLATADLRSARVFEAASGSLIRELVYPAGPAEHVRSISFTSRGKHLAVGTVEGSIHRIDLVTGRPFPVLRGECGEIVSLAGSPDGKLLASGNADTTALIWDVSDSVPIPPAPPDPNVVIEGLRHSAEFNRLPPGVWLWHNLYRFSAMAPHLPTSLSSQQCDMLWNDLGAPDAGRAYPALWSLAACPRQAVPFLRDKLRPVAPADPKVLARDLADLGADRFQVRQEAFRRLQSLGDLAVPALRQRLAGNLSAEEAQKLRELLRAAKRWPPDQLRALRAVQVLEYAGTHEARLLLNDLAAGAPAARVTQEARAAVKRPAE